MRKKHFISELKKLLSNEEEVLKYKEIHQLDKRQSFCCWVHEAGGYWAYCHNDGRLITRTGNSQHTDRTWSSVGQAILTRNGLE